VRTWGLLFIAVSLIIIGFASFMSSDWEMRLGPITPVATLPPQGDPADDLDPLPVVGLIPGLHVKDLGLPAYVAASDDKVFVADAYATTGVIKIYDMNGAYLSSLGDIGRQQLSYVVAMSLDKDNNLVVLDAGAKIFVYNQAGQVENVISLDTNARPELAWSRAALATDEGFFVLALDSVFQFNKIGKLVQVISNENDEFSLAMSPSEFYLGPSGLALHNDELWVSDSVNGRLLRLGSNGRFVESISMPEKNGVSPYPTAMQIDTKGNFYVVDAARRVLVKLSSTGEVLSEVKLQGADAIDGPDDVYSLALTSHGQLLVADSHAGTITLWNTDGKLVNTGALVTANARFLFPRVIEVGEERMYIASGEPKLGKEMDYSIYQCDLSGSKVSLFAKEWDFEPLRGPADMVLHGEYLYVLDGSRVLVFTELGEPKYSIGEDTSNWDGFGSIDLFGIPAGPQGLAVDIYGHLWVADTHKQRLVVFDGNGDFLRQVALGEYVWPKSINFAPDGTVLILNAYEGQVIRMELSGQIMATYGSPGSEEGQLGVVADMNQLDGPRDLVVAPDGTIYVVDTYNSRIVAYTDAGNYQLAVGGFGSKTGEVYLPSSIAYHAMTDNYYLTDTFNHRIQVLRFLTR